LSLKFKASLFLFIFLIIYSYWYISKIKSEVIVKQDINFLLKKTISQKNILKQLEFLNINISYLNWRIISLLYNKNFVPKAGEYLILKGSSISDLQKLFQNGNTVTRSFTLIEGWTANDLMLKIMSAKGLFGKIPNLKEGIYKPDTYNYKWGYSRKKLLTRMKFAQDLILNDIWKNYPKSVILKSKYDLLVLASIIQREAKNFKESQLIASVFINRLNKNMKLQSDVTLAYGLNINGKKLTKKMLRLAHPYNTYFINGLPPTPISYPSTDVLKAFINLKKTNYFYFVSNGKGEHRFSRTYSSHKKNIKIWKDNIVKEKHSVKK